MKAAVFTKYGPPEVLEIKEISKPSPQPNQILIRNKATAVTAADHRVRGANFPKGMTPLVKLMFGITGPRKSMQILGSCFSGTVEAVGAEVKDFKVGDDVCGMTSPPRFGAYAEYIVMGEHEAVVKKPKSVSHEEAAGVSFGGTTALYFLRDKGKVTKKDHVLVNGASGAVGTNVIQLAKHFGARVTAVCSGKNAKLVKKLGADEVIDYTKENLLDHKHEFDVVVNSVSSLNFDDIPSLLKPGGRAILILADMVGMLKASLPFLRKDESKDITYITGTAPERKEDVEFLINLVDKGKLKVVIDKEFPFKDIVAAHRHADGGHKVGNVVINMDF